MAGFDEFVSEKYADQIAAILDDWRTSLLASPKDLRALERAFHPTFQGFRYSTAKSRQLRSSPIEVERRQFVSDDLVSAALFLDEFQRELSGLDKLFTADFQVTRIDAKPLSSPARIETRIHYELVGTGPGFHREQRIGDWDLTWEFDPSGNHRILSWHALDETRGRARTPVFTDITAAALGGNSSYSDQLVRGTDYWRTVLDAASGIDVYGHNGVSVGDIDNDGFDDLYVCQPSGLPNRLYRNRRDGTFEDITESAGVGVLENTACALFADIDNNGRQDLIVVRTNGPVLFVNEGNGKFTPKPAAFKFATPPQGTFTGAAIADYDRDGWLDIYFCLYAYYQGAGQYKYPSPYYDADNGPPNFLLRNNRDGTFHDVTRETGLDKNNRRYSFCCAWNDFNADGWPDLYVVNDFGRKNLYRNNGDGTFTDIAVEAGVEDIGAGMSIASLDYNNDGADDLYVANMWTAAGERIAAQENFRPSSPEAVRNLYRKHAMGNSLFANGSTPWPPPVSSVVKGFPSTTTNRKEHQDIAPFHNATMSSGAGLGRWSWSSDAFDFDHDGFADLYVVNGMVSGPGRDDLPEDLNSFFWRQVVAKSPDEAKPSHDYEQGWGAINEFIRSDGSWSGYERNVFFANNRDGTFSDISGVVGLDFREDGRSFVVADFDHDGRQEVFLKNRNAPVLRILKNVIEDLPGSISFRLQGTKGNRDAIGAVVTVETNAGRQQRSIQAGSGFLSQHSKELFFGLGAATGNVQATIRWPSGVVQAVSGLPVNHRVWIEEGSQPSRMEPFQGKASSQQPRPNVANEPAGTSFHGWHDAPLPEVIETWLLSPVAAPGFSLADQAGEMRTLSLRRGNPALIHFWTGKDPQHQSDLANLAQLRLQSVLAINVDAAASTVGNTALGRRLTFPILRATDDLIAIYNIVFHYLFDRHRDMPLPASLLIDDHGDIVKVYQGRIKPAQVERDAAQIPRTTVARIALALPFSGITDATDFPRKYLSYGSAFFQRGYYEQAGDAFARAAQDDPESAEARYGIGSVYLNQQKLDEARVAFEKAVKLREAYPGTLANAWNNLGLIEARQASRDPTSSLARMDRAITCFDRALELSPDHVIALVNLGSAYRQLRQWDKARTSYEHALAASPDDPEANYGAGMVAAQTGTSKDDLAHAEQYLLHALQARPVYPEALNNLGILYLRTQRRDEAMARFEECIRVAPAFDQAYLNLARVYAIEGAQEKARGVLQELLRQRPGHAEAEKMLRELPRR